MAGHRRRHPPPTLGPPPPTAAPPCAGCSPDSSGEASGPRAIAAGQCAHAAQPGIGAAGPCPAQASSSAGGGGGSGSGSQSSRRAYISRQLFLPRPGPRKPVARACPAQACETCPQRPGPGCCQRLQPPQVGAQRCPDSLPGTAGTTRHLQAHTHCHPPDCPRRQPGDGSGTQTRQPRGFWEPRGLRCCPRPTWPSGTS